MNAVRLSARGLCPRLVMLRCSPGRRHSGTSSGPVRRDIAIAADDSDGRCNSSSRLQQDGSRLPVQGNMARPGAECHSITREPRCPLALALRGPTGR